MHMTDSSATVAFTVWMFDVRKIIPKISEECTVVKCLVWRGLTMPLGGRGLTAGVYSIPLPWNLLPAKFAYKVMLMWERVPKLNSCIIPCYMLLYFALGSYFFYSVFLKLDLLYCRVAFVLVSNLKFYFMLKKLPKRWEMIVIFNVFFLHMFFSNTLKVKVWKLTFFNYIYIYI